MKLLAVEIGKLPNTVTMEGHTDSKSLMRGKKDYSNWELSADRANAARRWMQANGMREDQVTQVRGFADQSLRNKDDPEDASNRRVTLIIQYKPAPLLAGPAGGSGAQGASGAQGTSGAGAVKAAQASNTAAKPAPFVDPKAGLDWWATAPSRSWLCRGCRATATLRGRCRKRCRRARSHCVTGRAEYERDAAACQAGHQTVAIRDVQACGFDFAEFETQG